MNRIAVSSSNLASVGYDAFTKTLEIAFRSGGVYQYSNVPQRTYDSLMSASSKGTYFSSYIKEYYSYRKVG